MIIDTNTAIILACVVIYLAVAIPMSILNHTIFPKNILVARKLRKEGQNILREVWACISHMHGFW